MSDDQQTPPAPDGAGGPAAPPQLARELTPEQVEQIIAQDTRQKLYFLCELFAPHVLRLQNGPEELERLAVLLGREQCEIRDKVLPTIVDAAAIKEHAFFGVKLTHHANPNGAPLLISGPKRLHATQPAHLIFGALATIMLMLQPEYRGLLRIYGVRYEFIQAKAPDDKPKIQLVSSMPKGGFPRGRR